jgi:predicted nucleic acid-binding protein
MYDALFVQLAGELDLPLLTTDRRLQRAAEGSVRIEVLRGTKTPDPA